MKQNKEQKHDQQTRPKKPKPLLFTRLFLKRLIPFLLISACCVTSLTVKAYREAEQFSADGTLPDVQSWYSRTRSFLDSGMPHHIAEDNGLSAIMLPLTSMTETSGSVQLERKNVLEPYLDLSVLVFRPETCELLISKPTVLLHTYQLRNQNGDIGEQDYEAGEAESEQIAEQMRDYCSAHSIRIELMRRLKKKMSLNETQSGLTAPLFVDAVPLQAAVSGLKFTALEYTWIGRSRLSIGTVESDGRTAPGRWKTVSNDSYLRKGSRVTRVPGSRWSDDTAELQLIGYPTDCRAGAVTQEIADRMAFYQTALSQAREEAKQNGGTAEEKLLSLTENSLRALPENAGQIIGELKKQPENRRIRYYFRTAEFTVKDQPCKVLAVQTLDMQKYLFPITVINSFQFLLASMIPALLWTLIVYPKAYRKQEAIEEYLRKQA